jgi:diguanylate cyclase (GGDEF)-like protein
VTRFELGRGLIGVVMLTAPAAHWLSPWAWAAALTLVLGAAGGAWLARRQVAADVAALVTEMMASSGSQRSPDLVSPSPPQSLPQSLPHLATQQQSALLQPVADGLQRWVAHQQRLLDSQADALELLRQQAHADPLTGLPNRRFFMATLDAFLAGDGAPIGAGLLRIRVCDLQGMNQRIGHAATDHVLQALAQALRAYPQRIERCCAGRLNGADFVLLLPVGGLAVETAASLVQALQLPIARIDPMSRVAAGGVELTGAVNASQALALADAALARAEADPSATEAASAPSGPDGDASLASGESSWQRRIGRALVQGRVALGAFPVRTADGRQLHLDCPLRVQLEDGGPLEPAARWLSLATRSRLCAAVDERALAMALEAIALDGVARCINIAGQSVTSAEFVTAVSRRLQARPAQACRLWIDLPEALALERPMLVRELSRRWRPLGVMLGLEHAGQALARIPSMIDLGLDCVRIDARFVNGLVGAETDSARLYLKGLVRLVQSVGLQVFAEGVRSVDDLDQLWEMGFDAATGSALVAESDTP